MDEFSARLRTNKLLLKFFDKNKDVITTYVLKHFKKTKCNIPETASFTMIYPQNVKQSIVTFILQFIDGDKTYYHYFVMTLDEIILLVNLNK